MSARRHAGFTIAELSVVLASLAVVSSLAIPAWFGRPEVTLDNAARLLALDLRDVQNRAALYGETLRVEFLEDGTGYQAESVDGVPLLSPYGARPYERSYDRDAVFRGVVVESVEFGGLDAVVFTPQGTSVQGARIVLAYRDERRTLRVRPFSGQVEIDGVEVTWNDDGL